MWRILILTGLFLALASAAQAAPSWQVCEAVQGVDGPHLDQCRPLRGPIDPQGRDIWIKALVFAPEGDRPHALHLAGVASAEAWLNGRRLGTNGRPGSTAEGERPGRYQAAMPIPDSAWRPGANLLVVHLSSFHGGLRLNYPVGAVIVAPYPLPSRTWVLAVTLMAAGTLLAAAFGFGVIHAIRRTGSSLILAAIAAVAALQAMAESVRPLFGYPYPLHVWRLGAIWLLAAAFAVLLVSYVAGRLMPGARRGLIGLAGLGVAATVLLPGFDLKTGAALLVGVTLSLLASAAGVHRRLPGARLTLAYLALFMGLSLAFPERLVDLSYFLLAAGLVMPLLMAEVVRLGREDRGREDALTRAAGQPNRLTVASARGVELVPISDILAVVGADDYVELRLIGGRTLLHSARLDRLQDQLPSGFQRIHRSAIANLALVRSLQRDGDRWRLQMPEGPPLPVSRSRLPALREALDDANLPRSAG
ncbi:MAG: LytTR family transcriptional regulator DNA-binding domain-containing protein [Alphaproteobacteria bacterium]|jgi:DNA-binding LytR/AlgR family response regulator|nr:LytTR family transcriptional regulator DNA-binding domain-containing protein [Alphaproteobacteria bacterium]MBU2042980.1 LytTR family transcriptional regulator DNA-binding domain-containing protein [Alphaproteobacteria bacterium]MBU2124860.1 LytTR family transcriptional regulator DNA-binding domain-containing protein [Alphaproteobacteria bacterium]MBU2208355.1 LytTR family transcriptional regulator DNA-binding domain-containing protein [Alphaproteobacteria bacterium]MBU2291089.1 LytTR family